MPKLSIRTIGIFIIIASIVLASCTKPENKQAAPSLTWTVGGSTYTADVIDAAYSSNLIIAEKDPNSPSTKKHLEILLAGIPGPGFVAGTYILANGGGNTITYGVGTASPSTWPYSASGTLIITAKNGDVISGNFSATLNGANGPISGAFSNISIQ